MSRPREWKLTVQISATDFSLMKSEFAQIAKRISAARTYRELPITGNGGDGWNESGYSVTCESPVEARIEQLRKEANELETTLSSPPPR